jgi:hypothetical protein
MEPTDLNHSLCSDHCGDGPTVNDLPIPQGLKDEWLGLETRRHFLGRAGKVLAMAGLASLSGRGGDLLASLTDGRWPVSPHIAPKAKRAIYLFMAGAPSQFETWDYKPKLASYFGQDLPESVRDGQILTGMTAGQDRFRIAPSAFAFQRHGKSGHWVSELFPETARVADELAVIKSLHTDAINHEPAILQIATGSMVAGKASIGSWLAYGLGSINEDLPTFVVLTSKLPPVGNIQALSSSLWSSGFLPPDLAGVALRSGGDPVLHVSDPPGVSRDLRRAMLDGVSNLNQQLYEKVGDPETHARIAQYEMAFRMQASVPELTDLSKEPQSTWDLYGPSAREPGTFAHNCLLARRMAERGVRFTQIFHRGWDSHSNLPAHMRILAGEVDRPTYALITDLKQRGLLDDTLVIWGGEFGRTVYSQGTLTEDNYGRDHHPRCFPMWLAGGGVKPGLSYGETDDFSYNIVKDPMHIRDLHATILHLFGMRHDQLSFRFQGLDQRLTGTDPARVVRDLLA